MENQDYRDKEDFAQQIHTALKDAFESMEFGQLNQVIGNTISSAMDKVKQPKRPVPPKKLEIRVNKRGRVSGILFTVFGSIGSIIFSAWALAVLLAMATTLQNPVGWWLTGVLGMIAGGFLVLLFIGIRNNGRIGRLKEYLKELKHNGKTYCELQRLSQSSARSLKYVQKDIRKMLELGMLPDARLDDSQTCLLLDEETYRQYKMAQDSLKERQQREAQDRDKEKQGQRQEPVWEAIARGEEYKQTLDKLQKSMSNQPISEKLLRLDVVLESLFEALKKHPEQLEEMERFMEYYLPTTVKLVTAYQEFAAVEFPGDNVKGAKKEIEQTIDTINHAFEKLLDDFYQDTAFDVLSDASALQSMLASQGLTGRGFDLK